MAGEDYGVYNVENDCFILEELLEEADPVLIIESDIDNIKEEIIQNERKENEQCKKNCCQEGLPLVFEDSFATFGRFVADELRFIKNDLDRTNAKMKISTILYKACTGKFDDPNDDRIRDVEKDPFLPQVLYQNDDDHASFGKYVAEELRKTISNVTANQITKYKISAILCQSSIDISKRNNDFEEEFVTQY